MSSALCRHGAASLIAAILAAGCPASEGSSHGESEATGSTGESTTGESGSQESTGATVPDVPMACEMAELPMGLHDSRCLAYYRAAECCGQYEFNPDNDSGAEEGCGLLYDSPQGCEAPHDAFIACFVETARRSCADAALFWERTRGVALGEPLPPDTPCFEAIQAAVDEGCAVPPSIPPA